MDISELKKIAANFKKRFVKRRMRRMHLVVNAHRDWKIILLSAVVVSVVLIAFSAYLFLEIRAGEIFRVAPSAGARVSPIDHAALSETLFYYSEKERRHEALRDNPPLLADPSE